MSTLDAFLYRLPGNDNSILSDDVRHAFKILSCSGMGPRKAVLKMLRVGYHPADLPHLQRDLGINQTSAFRPFEDSPYAATTVTYFDLMSAFTPYLRLPVIRSYLSSLVKCLPFYTARWRELEERTRLDSYYKEMEAACSPPTRPDFDYNVWFHREAIYRYQRLHPLLPFSPAVSKFIHRRFEAWKGGMEGRTLYPKMTKKHTTRATTSEFQESTGVTSGPLSAEDLERYYGTMGWFPQGTGVEMKQAWFYNDLKPRTYYAYSGRSYELSRYVQGVFNTLIDLFTPTHRHGRFNLSRLNLLRKHVLVIYDYSSFTSSLDQQRGFIDALADYCSDTHVQVFDSFHGYTQLNLGDLLRRYNELNHHFPCVSGRLFDELAHPVSFQHLRAGYLGVHGNLASCTLIHGLLVLHICQDPRLCSIVGDDALMAYEAEWFTPVNADDVDPPELGELHHTDLVIELLELLGDLAREKTAILMLPPGPDEYESHWTYLKRPLSLVGDESLAYLTLSRDYPFPTLSLLYDCPTTRQIPGVTTSSDKLQLFLRQLSGLRKSIGTHWSGSSPEETKFLLGYFADVYVKLGLSWSGHWNHGGNFFGDLQVERFLTVSYDALPMNEFDLRQDLYTRIMRMPELTEPLKRHKRVDVGSWLDTRGDQWLVEGEGACDSGIMTMRLRMLEVLGYIQSDPVEIEFLEKDAVAEWDSMCASSDTRRVYSFVVLRPVPNKFLVCA